MKQKGILVINNPVSNVTFEIKALQKLPTPSNLSVDGTTVSFDPVENATSYEIYADGTSIGTYSWTEPEQEGSTLSLTSVSSATQDGSTLSIE